MASVISGEGEAALNVAIREHFNPGDELMLTITLPKQLSDEQLEKVADELVSKGIELRSVSIIDAGAGPELNLDFTNPRSLKGVSQLAFFPIIAILAEVGLTGALAWQVTSSVSTFSWLKMAILAGLVIVIGAVIYKQGKKQRA